MKTKPPVLKPELFLLVLVVVSSANGTTTAGARCTVASVTGTPTGRMIFDLTADIDMASDVFYAHLRRNTEPKLDILICEGRDKRTSCDYKDPAFQVEDAAKQALTILVPNMTGELEDTYVLQVYFNGSKAQELFCNLTMAEIVNESQNGTGSLVPVIAGVTVSLLVIIIIVIVACFVLRRRRNSSRNGQLNTTAHVLQLSSGDINSREQTQSLLNLASNAGDRTDGKQEQPHKEEDPASRATDSNYGICGPENKSKSKNSAKDNTGVPHDLDSYPWYFGSMQYDTATQLLLASRNRDGCFLVIDSTDKNGTYLLRVKVNGGVKNRLISHNESGFWIESGRYFATVPALIKHYQRNPGPLPHILTEPCPNTTAV